MHPPEERGGLDDACVEHVAATFLGSFLVASSQRAESNAMRVSFAIEGRT